jgi:hypothetical protein
MKPIPDSFCRLPWSGFSNDPDGKPRACCIFRDFIRSEESSEPMWVQKHTVQEIFHSSYMKNLRDQFRRNEKPDACSICWNDEANGYTSKRQHYLKEGFDFFKTMEDLDWEQEPNSPYEFQMIISNSCNLKCRSCDPSHSTLWQNENFKTSGNTGYEMLYGQSGDESGVLWNDRFSWYKNLKRLEIVGGEPFFVKQWHQIWNELIEMGYSENISLNMSTNATIIFPSLLENLWTKFGGFGVSLSIDGIDKQYEYLRHPGKWDVTRNNILKYVDLTKKSNHKMHCQVTTTIGWLNAWYLPEMHEFFSTEAPLKIWNNIIYGPEYLALWACPVQLKEAIVQKWSKYSWNHIYADDIEGMKKYMFSRSISDKDFSINLSKIKNLDKVRNECCLESFPEIKSFIEPFWDKIYE